MRRIHLFICFAFILHACAVAAFAATVEVRFLAIEGSETSLFVSEGSGNFRQLALRAYQHSDLQELPVDGEGRIALFREEVTESEVNYVLQASALVPAGASRVLAIYAITQSGPALYCFDDDVANFPLQSVRLINTTPVEVYSKVGDAVVQLAPFSVEILPIVHKTKRPVVKVVIVHKDRDGEWVPFYNKPTLLLPSMRLTGIAAVTRGGLAKAMGVSEEAMDVAPAEAKAEADFFTYAESARELGLR